MNNAKPLTEEQCSMLENAVLTVTQQYLQASEEDPKNLYRTIIDEVEKPLLEKIMEHTYGNQSRAAICMGINRATLRSLVMGFLLRQ